MGYVLKIVSRFPYQQHNAITPTSSITSCIIAQAFFNTVQLWWSLWATAIPNVNDNIIYSLRQIKGYKEEEYNNIDIDINKRETLTT